MLIDSLLFYTLICSKKQISSIIWFPKEIEKIDDLIQPDTKNKFVTEPVNLKDKNLINHIFRCLSSDGATVIDQDGFIQYLGVIVDLSKISIVGLKGTGESAASALAGNGTALKISQDGSIKFFTSKSIKPYVF